MQGWRTRKEQTVAMNTFRIWESVNVVTKDRYEREAL
jgi:hypothetical protein